MNSVDTEKIDQVIKILKETSDFFNKIEKMIEIGATGYEVNFEVEQFIKYISKKEEEYENLYEDYGNFLDGTYMFYDYNGFITIGNDRIRDLKEKEDRKREYNNIALIIKDGKDLILKKIGYLEFLKQKPKPKEISAKIDYEKDLDDFIGFLDEKFKEWEQSRSEKND